MGADLITVTVALFNNWERPDADSLKGLVDGWVERATDEDLLAVRQAGNYEMEDAESRPAIAAVLLTLLNRAADSSRGDSRNTNALMFQGDITLWIVGGTSWGDSPCEAFDNICDAYNLWAAGVPVGEWLGWIDLEVIRMVTA